MWTLRYWGKRILYWFPVIRVITPFDRTWFDCTGNGFVDYYEFRAIRVWRTLYRFDGCADRFFRLRLLCPDCLNNRAEVDTLLFSGKWVILGRVFSRRRIDCLDELNDRFLWYTGYEIPRIYIYLLLITLESNYLLQLVLKNCLQHTKNIAFRKCYQKRLHRE